MKHLICLAIEVDDKYSASDVKKEIEYIIPFCDSELFDTLHSISVGKSKVKTYQVWSRDHLNMIADRTVDTYEELVALENETGYSYSSFITTDDIDSISKAVQNEWNGDLQYQLIGDAS